MLTWHLPDMQGCEGGGDKGEGEGETVSLTQIDTPFPWTRRQEQAARLVAEDDKPDEGIASELGISRPTLARWKRHPNFRERVRSIVAEMRAAILSEGIADMATRIAALDDRWDRMRQVIIERAESPETAHVPGGKTGLIVHNVKGIGKGDDFQVIDLYEVDVGLLSELRAAEQQAAKQLGQWIEKGELTGKDGGPLEYADASLTDEERAGRIAAILERAREKRARQVAETDENMGAVAGAATESVPE